MHVAPLCCSAQAPYVESRPNRLSIRCCKTGAIVRILRLSYRAPIAPLYRFNADDGWAIASHIALSALMALFPFLIVLGSLARFLGIREIADDAVSLMFETWPEEVADRIGEEVHSVLTTPRSDILTLSLVL